MNWYLEVLKKYGVFDGRASRSEYWYFILFNTIIYVGILIVGIAIKVEFLVFIYGIAVIIPSLAVAVRRLHDTDRSGWWILISLIPLIGSIILLIFLVTGSSRGNNQYGTEP